MVAYCSQVVVEQIFITRVGDAIDLRIGGHDASRSGLHHRSLERGQEQGLQIARAKVGRRSVESALGNGVRGVVLRFSCDHDYIPHQRRSELKMARKGGDEPTTEWFVASDVCGSVPPWSPDTIATPSRET